MQNLLELNVKTQKDQTTSEKDQLNEIMSLFSEMNIAEFEPFLDENLNSDRHQELYVGKYHSLAVLNLLFHGFKESGDTEIEIEQGGCRGGCFKNCSVINLRGNNSKKNFAFVLEKENGLISNFHPCSLYEGHDKVAQKVDMGLYEITKNKLRTLKGEEPMTPKELERMKWGIDMLYEKYEKDSDSK